MQTPTRPITSPKDQHVYTPDNLTLEFCLKNTYFFFQGKYYKQVHGAAMGSPISALIANLFMEEFEVKAINCAPHSPVYG